MDRNKILIVEDDQKSRFALKSVLEYRGFEVAAMDTGEALEVAQDHQHFDVAVIDVRLPEEEGLAVARELRKRHGEIRVVFVTGHREGVELAEGDILLVKPIEVDLLCRLL